MPIMIATPYGKDLGERNALEALGDTPERVRALVSAWPAEKFEQSYAPGKWSARQLLIHLAQTELALTTRARFALTQPQYAAQAFSQDVWLPLDSHADARTALDAYVALRRLNVLFFRGLSEADRQRTFSHPEYGDLTVDWIANQLAGHDLHHLVHFQSIA